MDNEEQMKVSKYCEEAEWQMDKALREMRAALEALEDLQEQQEGLRDSLGIKKEGNKMQKSRIEWTDFSSNPVRGLCPVDCKDKQGKSYCYARKLYKRFHWNPEIRFVPEEFAEWNKAKAGEKIFVG